MKAINALPAAIAACVTFPAMADTDNKIEETIIVTATRTAQPLLHSLSSVSVLTASDIERTQSVDLPTLLGRLPGIDVDHSGGRGALSALRMRGTESDHVLVLVDGVRSSSATTGSTALEHIPLTQIERIEVVRGPKSSLYGAEAIGGVIQVFTKRGTATPEMTLQAEYGSHDLRKTSAGIRGSLDDTRLALFLAHEETDGIDRTEGNPFPDTDRDAYRETSVSASLDHIFANHVELGLSYLRNQGDTEIDSGAVSDHSEFVKETGNARLRVPLGESLTAGVVLGRFRDEVETFGSFPSTFETIRSTVLVQGDYALDEQHLISAGYDYFLDEVDGTTDFTADDNDNKAYFVQYQGEFGAVRTTASVRQDDNEAFGKHETGSLALGFDIGENTLLSVSYGTGFKAPTFNDLFYPFTDFGSFGSYEGNPNLKPEESDSTEILLRGSVMDVEWFFTIYRTDVENLIVSTATSLENLNEAEISGAEAGASFVVWGWDMQLSASYTDPRDSETDDMLIRRSRGKIDAEVSRRFGDFDVSVAWKAQSHRFDLGQSRLGGYNTLDIRGSYQLAPSFKLAAKVENVFDKNYTLIDGFETEGRTASISAQYSF